MQPTTAMLQTDDEWFYQLYFQKPGVAEEELERDVHLTMRGILFTLSGDAPRREKSLDMVPRTGGFLDRAIDPASLPPWLSQHDLDFYAAEFARTGFRGGLDWYRNIDRNWELLAPFVGAQVTVPALYIAGDRDLVVSFRGMDQVIAKLAKHVPNLRGTIMLPGCGHWTQQERAAEVSSALIAFLEGL